MRSLSIPRLRQFSLLIYVITLFLTPACMSVAEEKDGTWDEQTKSWKPKFTWTRFGEGLVANAPAHIKESEEKLAMYVAGEVAIEMKRQGITPNYNYLTRITHLGTDGTCGDCAEKLDKALTGAGLECRYIMVESNWIGTPNSNHGALAVMINGKIEMFDAWQHGRKTDTFEGFVGSKWNGMAFEDWVAEMKKQGYVRISGDGGVNNFSISTDDGIGKALKPWNDQLEMKVRVNKAREDNMAEDKTGGADIEGPPNKPKDAESSLSKESDHIADSSDGKTEPTWTDLLDQKMREIKAQKEGRDEHLDDLKEKSEDFGERLKAKKREMADLEKDIEEYQDLVRKGGIPSQAMKDKYNQNERELAANMRYQDKLRSEREKQLQETENVTLENSAFDMITSFYEGGSTIPGSWWDSYFDSSEEKNRSNFEASQSGAGVVLNERVVVLDAARGRADSEDAKRLFEIERMRASLSVENERARAEAKYKRENSWGAWAQSLLLNTTKGAFEGFGSGIGNRIGSGIIEHEISKHYPEQPRERPPSGGSDLKKEATAVATKPTTKPGSVSVASKTTPPPVVTKPKSKPGSVAVKPKPVATVEARPPVVIPPAPTCSHNYQAQWVQYTAADGSGGSRCTGFICSKCGKWSPTAWGR